MQVKLVLNMLYDYTKQTECCDQQCRNRLRALTTVHVRGPHFSVS